MPLAAEKGEEFETSQPNRIADYFQPADAQLKLSIAVAEWAADVDRLRRAEVSRIADGTFDDFRDNHRVALERLIYNGHVLAVSWRSAPAPLPLNFTIADLEATLEGLRVTERSAHGHSLHPDRTLQILSSFDV